MVNKVQLITPDYYKIFYDLISVKFPNKKDEYEQKFRGKILTNIDVMEASNFIFKRSDEYSISFNQKHKSYDANSILEILTYQKTHILNNSEISRLFQVSRNSIAKWKKQYQV